MVPPRNFSFPPAPLPSMMIPPFRFLIYALLKNHDFTFPHIIFFNVLSSFVSPQGPLNQWSPKCLSLTIRQTFSSSPAVSIIFRKVPGSF